MTRKEMKTIFEEIVKSGVVLHVQYNRGRGQRDYRPGTRYNVQYVEEHRVCRVTSGSGQDCGLYDVSNVVMWLFDNGWKIDDVFVEEWLEQYLVPDTISDDVEELL